MLARTMTHVLILGGYGATGRALAPLLLQDPALHITIAGRRLWRAERAAAQLSAEWPGRVAAAVADASSAESLMRAFAGVDLVVVASSTAVQTQTVARAALRAGADYYDIIYSLAKLGSLRALRKDIERSARCFITDGGFQPGLPAVLVRSAAGQFDELHTALVGSAVVQDWTRADRPPETVGELLDLLGEPSADDQWQARLRAGTGRSGTAEAGAPLGLRSCHALALEELRALPQQYPTLRSTGFYVGGFNFLVNWGLVPLAMLGRRFASPRPRAWLRRLLAASLRRAAVPPFLTVLRLEATGLAAGERRQLEVEVSHPDGCYLTAACVAAGVRQLLDLSIRRPGLWLQALAVDPVRTLAELRDLGVGISQRWVQPVLAGMP